MYFGIDLNCADATHFNSGLVTLHELSVLNDARWQALRDTMTVGMMFVDEYENISVISREKLVDADSCSVETNVSLVTSNAPVGWADSVWANTCISSAPTAVILSDSTPGWAYYTSAGASLYNMYNAVLFDVWPYSGNESGSVQNTLFYYLK